MFFWNWYNQDRAEFAIATAKRDTVRLAVASLAGQNAVSDAMPQGDQGGTMPRISGRMSALLVLAFVATGGAMKPADAATYVYVGNAQSNDIDVLKLDPQTGDLTPVEKVAMPGISKPGPSSPLAIAPDKRNLYMAIRAEPYIAASFEIDQANGKLKPTGFGPLNESLAYISIDPGGRFILGASYGGNRYTVNPISPERLVWPPQYVAAGIPKAHEILADPGNRFVLGTSLGSDRIYQFRFDARSGDLQPNDPPFVTLKEKSGPRHFRFHPNGKLVFVVCELDGSVYTFGYDADKGALAQKHVISTLPAGYSGKIWTADLHLSPDAKFLYVSERGTSEIAAFSVGDDGVLTAIDRYPTEEQPRGFNIDPSGRYLLAVGEVSNSMTSYAIDGTTGTLTKLKQYPMGKSPNWVEIIELP